MMDVITDVEVALEVPTLVQSYTAYQPNTDWKSRDDIVNVNVIAIAILARIGIVQETGEKTIVQAEGIGPGIDVDHESVMLGGTTGEGAAKGISDLSERIRATGIAGSEMARLTRGGRVEKTTAGKDRTNYPTAGLTKRWAWYDNILYADSND